MYSQAVHVWKVILKGIIEYIPYYSDKSFGTLQGELRELGTFLSKVTYLGSKPCILKPFIGHPFLKMRANDTSYPTTTT